MFRKFIIATVASLSFLSPLAVPAESQAAHPVHHAYRSRAVPHRVDRAHDSYRVYYRSGNGAWSNSINYRSRADAARAASSYRGRGYEAYVR
jgi:hypothetical protein